MPDNMKQYSPSNELISIHIPKSGGTSFDKVLKHWFGFGFCRHYYNHAKAKTPLKINLRMGLKSILPICVHGHFDSETPNQTVWDYYPKANQFISIYRDPLELQMSYYFYQKKLIKDRASFWNGEQLIDDSFLGKDIDEHLEEKSDYNWLKKSMPFEINLLNYKEVIENNFIHIGITDKLQRSVDIFAEKLNKKTMIVPLENASVWDQKPSESSIRKFKENNVLEYAFYDYACTLNK